MRRKKKKSNKFIYFLIILIIGGAVYMYFNKDNDLLNVLTDKEEIDEATPYKKYDNYISSYLDRYIAYKEKYNYPYSKTITYVNIGLDYDFYDPAIVKTITNPSDPLVLVNKFNQMPKDYSPALFPLDSSYAITPLKVTLATKNAFENLCDMAALQNLLIKAFSTYRTYDYQLNLYNNTVTLEGEEQAEISSARAGFSEHHTGLAIDVQGGSLTYEDFKLTDEYIWLKDHAHEFGFIIRYQKGKEKITGYMSEEWHIRYVGVSVATYIYETNTTFDEYYAEFIMK